MLESADPDISAALRGPIVAEKFHLQGKGCFDICINGRA